MFPIWPFNNRRAAVETRADYTDAAIRAILEGVTGGLPASWRETAAAIAAASIVGRSLAVATVEGASADRTGLTSATLNDLGRAFILEGEGVYLIEVDQAMGKVELRRASDWEVIGGPNPLTWRYRLTIAGPTRNREMVYPAEAVFHPRINETGQEPHKGQPDIGLAVQTARLAAGLERQMANESNQPSGSVLPAPLDHIGPDGVNDLKADLRTLAGRLSLVPSMASAWGEGRAGAPADWQQRRIGFNPPEVLGRLRESVFTQVLAAAGIPPDLFVSADQTAKREALRQFLHATLQPLADVIITEARAKLAASLTFKFDGLYAADVQGRARAFQSLVAGGMEIERAAMLSGLLVEDEA